MDIIFFDAVVVVNTLCHLDFNNASNSNGGRLLFRKQLV